MSSKDPIDARGLIDYVTCGTGSYFDFYKLMPTFVYAEKLGTQLSAALKQVVRHGKVQAESHIRTPDNAEADRWRGCGTAWHLAEQGHEVVLVTPEPMIGKELVRTAADQPLRKRLKRLGVSFVTEALVMRWHGDGATVRSFLDGSEWRLAADSLALSTTNRPDTMLSDALAGGDITFHSVGDCVAPRPAAYPFYEGRKLALTL